ncbi:MULTISPECIES: DUF6798 domain-containing protein [Aphanothece]|uniref:DUF6798 domain-containing protein n=1 Tax=Aphanothece TaxID=1121 RepID=UPI0039853FA5
MPPAGTLGNPARPGGERWRSALAIGLVITALCLFDDNLASNEAGKLALARQQVEPAWIPHDWYLNSSQGYQWLFQQLSGRIVIPLGFPLGSLVVRLLGYALWAWGLAGITVPLGLSAPLAALAAALFSFSQGVVAAEWMVGGAEPKTFAYATLLLAYAAWRDRRWWASGLYSGLACSFHLLVGGFGILALTGLALLDQGRRWNGAALGRWLGGCLLTALPVSLALAEQLVGKGHLAGGSPPGAGSDLPSAGWIYVVLRNPHHLLPSSWSWADWARALLFLGLLALGVVLSRARRDGDDPQAHAGHDLALWVVMSWPPALIGLLIALRDPQSSLLQIYPFRLADTLLMLGVWLLLAAGLQPWLRGRPARSGLVGLVLVISLAGLVRELPGAAAGLRRQFVASEPQAELYGWIRRATPTSALVMAPPSGFEDLSLQTGRAGYVQFKQIPTASAAIHTWYCRLTALAGDDRRVWEGPGGWQARERLGEAYAALTPPALLRLADHSGATVVITRPAQAGPAGWREGFRNGDWTAWRQP